MKKRIFVAIKISPELREKIIHWEEKFRQLPVRWLNGKNLHLTLIPPWYEENPETTETLLKNIIGKTASFKVEFRKVTYGPAPRSPRLIWAAGDTPKELINLKTKLEKILNKSGEARPLFLHLTLARFRPEDFSAFPIKKLEKKILWRERVNSVVLMESHLARSGADYEILSEIPLEKN